MLGLRGPQHHGSPPRGTPRNLCPKWPTHVDVSVGPIRSQIAAEGLLIAQRSQWRAYGKSPSLFPMVPSLTYDLPSPPQMGFHMPPRYVNGHISATGDPIHFMFGSRVGFSGTADRMTLFSFRTNPRWRPPPSWKKLKWPYLCNGWYDTFHVWF